MESFLSISTIMKNFFFICLLNALSVCLFAQVQNEGPTNLNQLKKIKVVATTTMIGDMVFSIAGNTVELHSLMGPGVDPHLYKASADDIRKLKEADLVFYNGLMLEGKMQADLESLNKETNKVYAVTQRIPSERLIFPESESHHPDPHVWFDPTLWVTGVPFVAEKLSALQPEHANRYANNAKSLEMEMLATHQWAKDQVALLEPNERILITSHDAFNYFGRAYSFKVVGVQGISTATEAGLSDINRTVDFIKKNHVPVIFVESSVSPVVIESISQSSGAEVGPELFSDACGVRGQIERGPDGKGYDVGTWEGMMRHNINTVVYNLAKIYAQEMHS
jgi:manganese/zinc/iron transport system substrate-binding protein